MNGSRRKTLFVFLLSNVCVFLFAGIFFFLYQRSGYISFRFSGIFLTLLGVVNFLLLIFKKDIPLESGEADCVVAPGEGSKFTRLRKKVGLACKRLLRTVAVWYNKARYAVRLILLFGTIVGGFIWFSYALASRKNGHNLTYWHILVLAAMFVVTIIVDKYIKYFDTEELFYKKLLLNCRSFFTITKILSGISGIAVSVCLLGVYDLQTVVRYCCMFLFYYVFVMLIVSIFVHAVRKELSENPGIVILLPFFNGDIQELSVLSFLEENTGITLRSLWSLKFIRKTVPVAFFAALALLWLSSGLVYVESYQEGAVYRFGVLQEETLKPGLHWTLPYPVEKTKVYDTDTIRKITIGYKSVENEDNLWTEAHGDTEYKLLLGSGNELVSINLRIEYRIDDLYQFLKHSSQPERILEAKAYEITTDRTIGQNLTTLLTIDRAVFTESFRADLSAAVDKSNTGLEVVNVIMESIHPPVEVASVYQRLIGARNEAEKIVLDAEAYAATSIFRSQSFGKITVDDSLINYYQRISAAKTEVSEFMAAVEAYSDYPDEYMYYKYLKAICSAYARTKLVLVGQDVDSSRIQLIYGTFN